MKSRFLWLALGAIIAIILLLLDVLGVFSSSYTYKGSHIEPPLAAPDFRLVDQHGQPFQLSEQEGKVVLLFFGYTYCPDVCPDTLARFKRLNSALSAQEQEDLKMVFITVDPQRDTPEQVGGYLAVFDPGFVGLVGPQPELEQSWQDYGVYAQKSPGSGDSDYLVDHTARVYAVDKKGNLRLTYSFNAPVEDMLADVRHLLGE